MKILFNISLVLISLLFFGCSTSNYFLKPNTNLNAFKFVLIKIEHSDYHDIIPFIERLFLNEGIEVITESKIKNFNIDQYGQTIYCLLRYDGGSEATANIRIYNYKEELIYNGEGTNTGLTTSVKSAVESAFSNFARLYTGYDPKYALNPAAEFKEQFKNWEKINLTEYELKNKLSSYSSDKNPLEGIWSSIEDNQYRIGIIRDDDNTKRDFVAFILETDNPLWEEKQVKIEFNSTSYKSVFSTTYFMSDHSKQGTTAFINDKGILEIKLKNPEDNSELNATFIKNYPSTNENSFVDINKENSQTSGTGFIISESGLIVTNWHVVENRNLIEVFFPQINKTFNATTVIKDSKNDIAILKLSDFTFSKIFNNPIPYPISSSSNVKQGNKVFTLGFPLGNLLGQTSKLSDGIINSLYGIQDDPRLMQISNPIQPGNSGGPLFNSSGEIIGIVVATLNAKYFYENADIIPQNVNFAVKSDYLLNLSSMLPEDKEITQRANNLKGLQLDKQVEMISPFIVSIRTK
ncbi:MAG: serine protease [Candidatus Lokiarchaeota archaeon]|nr:serine protease [Candidatus Lokiarchaeota archaeon]